MPTSSSSTPRFAVEAREAMQAHLATLFAREDTQHEQQEASADRADTPCGEATATQVIACPVPPPLPVTLSEAEQVELATENAARHDWIAVEALRANPAYARARQKHEQELAHAEKVIRTIKEEGFWDGRIHHNKANEN
jgi:hypothetical protein